MAVSSSSSLAGRESKAMDLSRRLVFLARRLPPVNPRFDSISRMSSMSWEKGQL